LIPHFQTFYVTLDLTTLNELLPNPKPLGGPIAPASTQQQSTDQPATPADSATPGHGAAGPAAGAAQQPTKESPEPEDNKIQILDLHSDNPIISYKSTIFSCVWSDLIGTDLLFTTPDGTPESQALKKGPGWELLAATRLRLLGQKAVIRGKTAAQLANSMQDDTILPPEAADVEVVDAEQVEPSSKPGASLGTMKSTNPKVNADRKRTAQFLEKLMDVKRAKGETDAVRTVYNHRHSGPTGPSRPRRNKKPVNRKAADQAEIQRLNKKVVQGDAQAMETLQGIYSRMEEDPEPADDPLPDQAEASREAGASASPPD